MSITFFVTHILTTKNTYDINERFGPRRGVEPVVGTLETSVGASREIPAVASESNSSVIRFPSSDDLFASLVGVDTLVAPAPRRAAPRRSRGEDAGVRVQLGPRGDGADVHARGAVPGRPRRGQLVERGRRAIRETATPPRVGVRVRDRRVRARPLRRRRLLRHGHRSRRRAAADGEGRFERRRRPRPPPPRGRARERRPRSPRRSLRALLVGHPHPAAARCSRVSVRRSEG